MRHAPCPSRGARPTPKFIDLEIYQMATFQEKTGTGNPFDGVNVGLSSTTTLADIDKDGDLDAFIGEAYGTIKFYRNDSGTFTSVTGTGNPFDGMNVGSFSAPPLQTLTATGIWTLLLGNLTAILTYTAMTAALSLQSPTPATPLTA
jgi:hypothetical protein